LPYEIIRSQIYIKKNRSHWISIAKWNTGSFSLSCDGSWKNYKAIHRLWWYGAKRDQGQFSIVGLHPEKLLSNIELSEKILNIEDLEIEVEYQADTIGKFGLDFDGKYFLLTKQQTDCLAKDNCGIVEKPKVRLSNLNTEPQCSPGGNCC
jgi:Tat protein secretion system quality control protein TatD with DNase activity